MSGKRLNKRQLREQQELEELAEVAVPTPSSSAKKSPFQQLAEPSDDEESAEEDEEQAAPVPSKKPTATSIFAALGDEDNDVEEKDDEEEEQDQDISAQQVAKSKKKNKKKNKKAAAAATTEGDGEQDAEMKPSQPKPSNKKSPSKKKSSAAAPAQSKDVSEMSIDEFDALLASQASLNTTDASSGTRASSSTAPSSFHRVSAFRTHLSLDPRNLDPAIELRRQFGSAAIKAYQSEAASSSTSHASGARARAQANNPNLKVRSLLCTPKDYWPPISRSFTGMSMDVHDLPSTGKICEWKHSKAYRQVQMQFLQAVRSYDPNSLMALLRIYPYHIDTLLQLSEYSRHQGDLGQAADFNDPQAQDHLW
ncbi:hypothetical protein NDA16_003609 [Ustilago loliicola]|nr:hypothetical protein NDA16_003609 [Ustilago loliicola]